MRYFSIIFFGFFFIAACSSNQDSNEDFNEILRELEEIDWESELEDEEAYDYDEEIDYEIEMITEADEVEDLSQEIKDLLEAKRLDDRWEMTLGERYVRGEADVRDDIVEVLKNGDSDERVELMWELNPYERPEFQLKDSKIINAVNDNLFDWRSEGDAIDLMAGQNLPNHLELFEKRLLSGESQYEGELIYQLGEEATSMKALNHLENTLRFGEIGNDQLTIAIRGLGKFRENGALKVQEKVDELCLYIYRAAKISNEDYESLEEEYDYGNPALELLEFLFAYGGKEVRPIALKYADYESVEDAAFECLVRLEGEKHRREIIERMKYEDTYISGLELVSVFYKTTGDERMLQSAITNFEYLYDRDDYSEYELGLLVGEIVEAVDDSATFILEEYLKDRMIKKNALALFDIRKMTLEDYGDYFLEIGLIEKEISPNRMARVASYSWGDELYIALDAAAIHFWFDEEEVDALSDYNYLLSFYKNSSLGYLEELEFAINRSYDDEIEYLAVFNGVGYVMWVGDREEWDYRIQDDMTHLINYILEENESERRFRLFNYDEYVFGTEEHVELLRAKFGINDELYDY